MHDQTEDCIRRRCTKHPTYTATCTSIRKAAVGYLGRSSQPSMGLSRRRLSWCRTVPRVKSPLDVLLSKSVAACVNAWLAEVMTGLICELVLWFVVLFSLLLSFSVSLWLALSGKSAI